MIELQPKWNGFTRGDAIEVNGQPGKFIHAAIRDGEVLYVMVTAGGKWEQVSPESIGAKVQRRKK